MSDSDGNKHADSFPERNADSDCNKHRNGDGNSNGDSDGNTVSSDNVLEHCTDHDQRQRGRFAVSVEHRGLGIDG